MTVWMYFVGELLRQTRKLSFAWCLSLSKDICANRATQSSDWSNLIIILRWWKSYQSKTNLVNIRKLLSLIKSLFFPSFFISMQSFKYLCWNINTREGRLECFSFPKVFISISQLLPSSTYQLLRKFHGIFNVHGNDIKSRARLDFPATCVRWET